MEAITQMLANGWPLALAGFFVGVLAGELMSRGRKNGIAPIKLKPGEDALSVLEAEISAVRQILQSEADEAAASEETLKNLDDAIKRANGRLKLIAKAVKRAK
jgi:hypothetical protein